MCNLYSDLLIFLCILLVYPDWFCLFFNTQPDFLVLFDMSVIYFIYIDAVAYLRAGGPGLLLSETLFLLQNTIFCDAQKNSSIFIDQLSVGQKILLFSICYFLFIPCTRQGFLPSYRCLLL